MGYPVKPFSGPNYAANQEKCGPFMPCVICGKPIENQTCWAEVIEGGAEFGPMTSATDANDPGYMGCYPVGPECRKTLEAAGVPLGFDHGD